MPSSPITSWPLPADHGCRHIRPVDLPFVWQEIWLKERIHSRRLRKVVLFGRSDWVHHLRMNSLDDLDNEVQGWLCRSYQVGCQRY
jgi:hypothetical protein